MSEGVSEVCTDDLVPNDFRVYTIPSARHASSFESDDTVYESS